MAFLRILLRLMKRVCKWWTRCLRRLGKMVYVEMLKPPRRYIRPSSTPGVAYDLIISGITLILGIAYFVT